MVEEKSPWFMVTTFNHRAIRGDLKCILISLSPDKQSCVFHNELKFPLYCYSATHCPLLKVKSGLLFKNLPNDRLTMSE